MFAEHEEQDAMAANHPVHFAKDTAYYVTIAPLHLQILQGESSNFIFQINISD
jgi:hypothetical protein